MQRKLDWLSGISDPPDSNGIVYVNMKFDDGTIAYKGAKPDAMTQHYADLLGIQKAGDLVEIDLEDTGKLTKAGAKKWKLVGYPGWSAPVAQGGKAQANASNGSSDREDAITRAVALKAAVEFSKGNAILGTVVLLTADEFYEWLVRGEGQTDAEVTASAVRPITERTTDPIPVSTSGTAQGEGAAATPDTSEGVGGSTGGSKRASTPEDNPWEGLDVV